MKAPRLILKLPEPHAIKPCRCVHQPPIPFSHLISVYPRLTSMPPLESRSTYLCFYTWCSLRLAQLIPSNLCMGHVFPKEELHRSVRIWAKESPTLWYSPQNL